MTPVSAPYRHTPVIGIICKTGDSQSVVAMVAQVRARGAIPRLLTNHALRDPSSDIQQIDALFVMGNDTDVDPRKYITRYPEGDPRRQLHPQTQLAKEPKEAAEEEARAS